MNPQVFGPEHLIYIAVSLVIGFLVCFFAFRYAKTEKLRTVVIKSAAAILFVIIFANRLTLVFEYETNWLDLIPDTFCSASSYILSITLLVGKRNNNVLHFIWLIALAGGVLTTFYPHFLDPNPSFMYPPTFLGMLHHTWSAIVVVLMFMFGWFELTYKKWYCTVVGFTCYLTFGAFLMCVLDISNPFYMTEPILNGTPLTVWVIAPIYMSAYAVILLVNELVKRKIAGAGASKSVTTNENESSEVKI